MDENNTEGKEDTHEASRHIIGNGRGMTTLTPSYRFVSMKPVGLFVINLSRVGVLSSQKILIV